MNKMVKKYIGKHYIFKLLGHFVSGYFCGIGEINQKYGMVFIDVKSSGIPIPDNCCMLVAPKQIKCTLKSNIINLRRMCRKIFSINNLCNIDGLIYYPTFQVNEIK